MVTNTVWHSTSRNTSLAVYEIRSTEAHSCPQVSLTITMNWQFKEIAERHGNPLTISRAEMQEAITAVAIVESDAEVRKS